MGAGGNCFGDGKGTFGTVRADLGARASIVPRATRGVSDVHNHGGVILDRVEQTIGEVDEGNHENARAVFDRDGSSRKRQDTTLDFAETRIELFTDARPFAGEKVVDRGEIGKRSLGIVDPHAVRRRARMAATASGLAMRPCLKSASPASI